jgi:hypothetical protein
MQSDSGDAAAAAPSGEQGPAGAPPSGNARSLPELIVENVGLHIGGGPNDAANKLPFERAIEKQFSAFRRCYLAVERPAQGGTFGVDLFIGAAGGPPEVRDARTGMSGATFRACVRDAFTKVAFEPPRKPTVISYSLRFRLAE